MRRSALTVVFRAAYHATHEYARSSRPPSFFDPFARRAKALTTRSRLINPAAWVKTWVTFIGCVLLAAAMIGLVATARWHNQCANEAVAECETEIRQYLVEELGIAALFTFEDPQARDIISGSAALCPGTVAVVQAGRPARQFDGREQTWLAWPLPWDMLGSNFTLSTWIRLEEPERDQDIFGGAYATLQTGLRYENGQMFFDVPAKERQCVSYPFTRTGEFVHVAATVDMASGRMRLYENGELKAEGPVKEILWPPLNLCVGKTSWYVVRSPFSGMIAETALWNRPLSAAEIQKLSSGVGSLLATHVPRALRWRHRLAKRWLAVTQTFCTVQNVFDSRLWRATEKSIAGVPAIRLVLSDKDRKHFLNAHEQSRRSGRRVLQAARPRRVHALAEGAMLSAQLWLHGSDTAYADFIRPGFVLEYEDGCTFDGCSKILLQPPEASGFLAPFVISRLERHFGVPQVRDGLCRLYINNTLAGIYRYSDYRQNGIMPGDYRRAAEPFIRTPTTWNVMFNTQPFEPVLRIKSRPWPGNQALLDALFEEVKKECRPLLLRDFQSPLNTREIGQQIRQNYYDLQEQMHPAWAAGPPAQHMADFLDEYLVLGSNRSPFYLEGDLDLSVHQVADTSLAWESSAPQWISTTGKVHQPTSGAPKEVVLTAVIQDPQQSIRKDLRFRVMPRETTLPAVFLTVTDILAKDRRVDAVVEFADPTSGIRRLIASQAHRAGVNHRGNTSYWGKKKLLSIKTDSAHGVFGDPQDRVLKTINARQDPSFLNNGLAYGLFREFSAPGAPRYAPLVRPSEVFVNGHYYGLYELCTRIDERLVDETPWDGEGTPDIFVYRHESAPPRAHPFRVSRPRGAEHSWHEPIDQLLNDFTKAEWLPRISARHDISSLIDLQILINLMQNRNGYPFPFAMHDALVYDATRGQLFHVPWDFDHPNTRPWEWLANNMMRRMEQENPDYMPTLAARWFALRQTVLSDHALERRIQALRDPIAAYVRWDYERWNYSHGVPHRRHVQHTRNVLRNSTAAMDAALKKWLPHYPATKR